MNLQPEIWFLSDFLANEWFKIQSVKSQVVIPKWKIQVKNIQKILKTINFLPQHLYKTKIKKRINALDQHKAANPQGLSPLNDS